MKILVTENQLNRLLSEYVVAPFRDLNKPHNPNYEYPQMRYEFDFALNGLIYNVLFLKRDGERAYEISFDYEGGNENHGAHKDIEHFNSVMYTIFDIMEYAAKNFKIKTIEFEGVYSDVPENKLDGKPQEPLRSRYYRRFLQQKYPADAVHTLRNRTYIDMTKVFPEVFDGGKKSRVDILFNIIEQGTGNSFSFLQKKSYLGSWYRNDKDFSISIDDLIPVKGNDPISISISVDANVQVYGLLIKTENYYDETDVDTFKELCQMLSDSLRKAVK